jgi:hypothetical protein
MAYTSLLLVFRVHLVYTAVIWFIPRSSGLYRGHLVPWQQGFVSALRIQCGWRQFSVSWPPRFRLNDLTIKVFRSYQELKTFDYDGN